MARHQAFDSGRIVEEHRGDQLIAFQLGVAMLEARLVLVGLQHLAASQVSVLVMSGQQPSEQASLATTSSLTLNVMACLMVSILR